MKINNLNLNEQKLRDLYLRGLALGEIQGPPVGYASIDKPWLAHYPEMLFQEKKSYSKVVDLLKDVWNHEEDIMLDYYGEEISSKKFFEHVDAVARSLKQLGYQKGDSIPISIESVPEFLYLFFACELIGVSLKNKLGELEEIIDCIKSTNSKYFFTHDYLSEKAVERIYHDTNIKHIIMMNPLESISDKEKVGALRRTTKIDILDHYKEKLSHDNRNITWESFVEFGYDYQGTIYEKTDSNTKLFSAYTSGSTGVPKEVIHTSQSFLGIINQMVLFPSHQKEENRDTWLLPNLPPTLVAVVVAMMCYPLADGKRLLLDPYCKVEDLDLAMMYYEPTCTGFGPLFFDYLLSSKRFPENYDMSYLKLLGFGAEPMQRKFIEQVHEFLLKHNCHVPFSSGYGQSEGGSDFTVALGKDMLLSGSSGIPLIDTTISIFEFGTNKELPYNEIGEICKSGPGIMLGYQDEEMTNKVLKIHEDGRTWLHTGDYGYMTKQGLLFVLGREAIQINDHQKVFPLVIENQILEIDGIQDAVVVSGSNLENDSYQVPYLFVVPESGVDQEELLNKIKIELPQKLKKEEFPNEIYVIDEKPISHYKTDRKILQKKYHLINKKSDCS